MADFAVADNEVCDAHGIPEKTVIVKGPNGYVSLCAESLASLLQDLTGWQWRNMYKQAVTASSLKGGMRKDEQSVPIRRRK